MCINNIEVSIVIVCMNNLKNLYPCLTSIREHTSVDYETFVVAYLFSQENLRKVKLDFPWVTFIESNEIRGFSENNNLALRQARGKYCFVVNDDTEMKMPVIDLLVNTIETLPEKVAIVSPTLISWDGKVQVCGVPPINWKTALLEKMHLWHRNKQKQYVNKQGIFKSYNIIGAAFLIKTDIFKEVGWFDERYFFCPEDIALSTTLNKMGYECYVNDDARIIHYEGMSSKSLSNIKTATMPAARRGGIMFFSDGNRILGLFLKACYLIISLLSLIYHLTLSVLKPTPNVHDITAKGEFNIFRTLFSNKSPKEIFIHYYNKLNKESYINSKRNA